MLEEPIAKITTGRDLLEVGDVVRIETGPDEGQLAIVYETYPDFADKSKCGVSIITEDNRDLGGWSFEEQGNHLEVVYRSGFEYEFKNHSEMRFNALSGMFRDVFAAYHALCVRESFQNDPEADLNA